MNLHRTIDRIKEYLRYSQPSIMQSHLLGLHTDVIDTDFTATRLASEESARYILEKMRTVKNFKFDYDYHKWIVTTQLELTLNHGLILEFGVATGRSLNNLSYWLPNRKIYGFDSFEGLPEDWHSGMPKGSFGRKKYPKIRSNCKFVVGWFNETLPNFVQENKDPIQLLHVDCDLYSSAVTILDALHSQIVPGTIVMFDEYINYPGWQLDEFKAWKEYVEKHKREYDYIGRVSRHQKVAVRVVK